MTDRGRIGASAAPTPVSLYVHVPFCVSKCAYCDFYSLPGADALAGPFVDAALVEVSGWARHGLLRDVPTLYVGGGTPTALGDDLLRLVQGIREIASLRADAEITVETNPETTDGAEIGALADAGVSRFSLGVQSFDDTVLRTLGRVHDAAKAQAAIEVLHAVGVPFSIDLMCGVPGQSFASWEATLEAAVASGARHVSVYPLTVEPGTPMAAAVETGRMHEPDEDIAADMMLAAEVALATAGLRRYEVANYAAPGRESRHNTVYWTGGAYLGMGPHAASMLPYQLYAAVASVEDWNLPVADGVERPVRARFSHEAGLEDYVRGPFVDPAPVELLSAAEAAREDVMLGLRLATGVSVASAKAAGVDAVLRRLAAEGLVEQVRGDDGVPRWRTTPRGWLLGNVVYGAVWAGE